MALLAMAAAFHLEVCVGGFGAAEAAEFADNTLQTAS